MECLLKQGMITINEALNCIIAGMEFDAVSARPKTPVTLTPETSDGSGYSAF